jgi:exosortase/archaeosortase family protein
MSAAALPGGGRPGDIGATGRHGGAHRTRRTKGAQLTLGLVAGVVGVALSAGLLKEAGPVRHFEAWLSGHVVPLLTGINAGSYVNAPVVWFSTGPHRYMGLLITPDCTIDELIIPFMLVTAWMVWRQVRVLRPLIGLAVAVCLLVGMNQFRLLLIVLLTVHYGSVNGFYWGHTLIGSMVTIFGFVLIFVVYVLIVVRRKRSRTPGPSS